jgi:hypothetical protein
LLLLLLGGAFTAGITNYLIPSITHEWQRHDKQLEMKSTLAEKELEIKGALVRNIGESIGAFLATIHSNELASSTEPAPANDGAYEEWSMSSNGIASQIHVYFRGRTLNEQWKEYSINMRKLYYLMKYDGSVDFFRRLNLLREIALYLRDKQLRETELKEIAKFKVPSNGINETLDVYFRQILDDFREQAEHIIKTILRTPSVLTVDHGEGSSPVSGR